jgi:hypothetical protein
MDIRYKSDRPGKFRFGRWFSLASLLLSVVALVLALRQPKPVAPHQSQAAIAVHAQSFQAKVNQLEEARQQGQSGSEVRLSADEVAAAIAQAQSAAPAPSKAPNSSGTLADASAPVAPGAIDPGSLEEPVISFEGDIVRGQFATQVAGEKTYVTIAGHLGSKDGYATFEPTEFKVGDLNVPVSLVNDALQKKMLEQQDRLKLPDFVSDVRVENGQLVVTQK